MDIELLLMLSEPAGGDVESLSEWLAGDPAFSGKIRLTSTAHREGAQGPGADAVAVALGSGGTVTSLAVCLRTWIQARYAQRSSRTHVEVTARNGAKVIIDASNAADAESLLRSLARDDQG